MAESAVSFLLEKLVPLLEVEGKLLRGVCEEVNFVKAELKSIRAFLKDADAQQESSDGMKAWVKQVRDVAYDTEDVLDEFMLHLAEQPHRHGFVGFLQKTARFVKNSKARHQIATQIQEIKVRVREISARGQRYCLNSIGQGSSSNSMDDTLDDLRGNALLLEEVLDLVGIDKPREELIGLLVEGESRLGVVWVVGMGGLGKTTLVKKVYDDQRVKRHFEHHAWITVSQSFKTNVLLRDLIAQLFKEVQQSVPQGVEKMTNDKLKEELKNFLQQKRYVIVFDDIWHILAWEAVKYALPDSKSDSRIMITTRSMECVEAYGHVYNLQPLLPEESWTLFCKKTFQSNLENSCPPQLEEASQIILQRCEGLPLAIVALGGLLSTKLKTVIEWEKVIHNLSVELEKNDKLSIVKRILYLSYVDLPYYLKSCFLYLSIFPEDDLIERMRLIRLWSAEGFIEEKEGRTLEEVADSYLNQLINRSLIQIAEITIDGSVKRCRVHDLMRDIILSQSREENFGTILHKHDRSKDEKIRGLSIRDSSGENVPQIKSFSHLRSLFIFGLGVNSLSNSSGHAVFSGFRLLKVADLRGAPLEVFPNEIVNLFHLRYLSMMSTKIKMIPNSIGKLQNLETLDLKQTHVSELPVGIVKLKKLRHLLVYRYDIESYIYFAGKQGFKAFMGIGGLVYLQKLCFLEANQGSGIIRELGRLNQLRRLGIIKLRKEDGVDLCLSIEKMSNLRSLSVNSIKEEEILDLQSLHYPPPLLQRLYMKGNLEELPHWISKLDNLVKICLRWSRLRDDPLEVLQGLPNLLELELLQAYNGEVLCFKAEGFQRLKLLKLDALDALRCVTVEEGAMPQLQKLYIERCGVLEKVPLGIERLTNLKVLHFYDMPHEFIVQLVPDVGGEDHWKVAHIPDVLISLWTDEEGFKDYRL